MTATTDNRELRDRHIAVLEGLLADAGEPDLRMSTDEKDAIRAAIALMRGQSAQPCARRAVRREH